ncbi:hypothetical protein [Pantoea dispersa]|uniref:hypothetical protein n=1 Tax=Pantoea dispersa TaxID=59814 RepID=UPI00123C54E6|nr:hypothetical protein [Pantoea dispersa]KAA8669066.1 hypothetical protein F4W08_17385 [Pantoea dispersa]
MKTAKSQLRQKAPDPDVSVHERPAIMVRTVHYRNNAQAISEHAIRGWQELSASMSKENQCS